MLSRMVDKVYTLAIHCRGKCKRLKNVDQDKYSYIDFLSDIREIHNVCDDGMLKISCSVDDSEVLMNITGDKDVLNMFSRNKNRTEFEVFVELCGVDKGVNEGEYYENKAEIEEEGEDSENEGSEEVEGSENEELSQTGGTESGESESWDEKKSGEKSDETGDELSNYISDDHCESKNESDSDFEDDPLQGSLNREASVLADEGFKIMRMRNEKTRVTGHCSVKDCPWRIHASPLADGVTFQIKTYVPNHTCVRAIWGVLLAAIGLDGNNGLFPVAFAIAESECKESWGFFFENLSIMLSGFSCDKPWMFMSDRQKVKSSISYGLKWLVETINEIVPNAVNRRCARHIYANFRGQFAGAALKRYFWQAARSYNVAGFNFALHKIKELKPAAYDWLLKIPAEMWSRHAFDERLKNDHVTNNISESFNHWVGDLRSKPVLTLVDGLRTKLMCRLQKRKLKGLKMSGDLVPNVVKELNKIKEESRKCHLLAAGEYEFEVQDQNINYIVNLRTRTCNCRVWNVSGIPCKDLELDIPLAQLASRKRKTKGSSSQPVAPTKTNKKTKAKSLSQPMPKPPISSSQPLPNTEHGPSMHVAGSTSQPPSNSGAAYLPPSFWRGLGVSPQREIRSKNNQDVKEVNPYEACKQQ
ncbi:hypothetical protein Sango_1603900 [Sesamum angolense]|uniref:SWIM-type domain-containing protein n=1 Tax=Sesamum angolense TaxID=2727404 RepID=A0AAE1WJH9_9LAMI|nr:hypothetical protein Sango_1603900 [Sesamum angolense]